jgi:allantoate deiminase
VSVPANKTVRASRVIDRCRKLATFSERPNSIVRTFLSGPTHDCHREIRRWLEPLKATVRIDAAGNLRAEYPGKRHGSRLLIGSHLDTVPDAGAFDGILGVVLGIALLEELRGERLNYGIEVIGFSEEEGIRFGTPFIGSRSVVGRVDEELLQMEDSDGISVRSAIRSFGLNPNDLAEARLGNDVLGFVEFHIEQGPVLEDLRMPLGVVPA